MQGKTQIVPTATSSILAVPQPISAKSIVITRTQKEGEVTSSPSNASKPVPVTPSSVVPDSAQPHNIKSAMSLGDWRGSITTFNGFTGTRPVLELNNGTWREIVQVLAPEEPAVLDDKSHGQFCVPCALKEAPLVGNTLEAATKNGQPTTGKMRSKSHVTEATMLVIDVDGLSDYDLKAGLAKIIGDGLTILYYTTYSHGSTEKPGMRARLIVPVNRPLDTEEYAAAWHGFDQHYWQGLTGQADSSGANLYQQQGTWCCHPDRFDDAKMKEIPKGVASADALIAIGRITKAACAAQLAFPVKSAKDIRISPSLNRSSSTSTGDDYPISDANKVADACQQIGIFRGTKGADQSEPEWFNALGVVAHCSNGTDICQEWSSGHADYNEYKTLQKIDYRLKTSPTTCAQFQNISPCGCQGCAQQCNSPITLGWEKQAHGQFKIITPSDENAIIKPVATPISDKEVFASLAAMKPTEYDRVRKEYAKSLGVQVKTLDDEVKSARSGSSSAERLPFTEIEPHLDPVDPAQVLDEVVEIIRRHIVMDKEQAEAMALWAAMTWFVDAVEVAPIAIITAPEKACGKSQLLSILGYIVSRPLSAANSTSSFLFRAISTWHPTILIDEADTFIRENDELKGLVNAGHTRASAFVGRTVAVGDGHEPKVFDVWGAKAFAGIALEKHLPDATMSRGIVIGLRRKMANETVSRLRHSDKHNFTDIAAKLARFADDYSSQVRLARPDLPDELGDRDQDNWEPLLAIAQCAGPDWLKRATETALLLSRKNEESVSTGNELLSDIQSVFESKRVDKTSTADLIEALIEDDEKPWATYNRGKPLAPRQLSKQLAAYGIRSKTVRFGHSTPKGFELSQFTDAFDRYLTPPPISAQQRNETPEPINGKAGGDADETQQNRLETETPNAMPTLGCGGVAAVSLHQSGDTGKSSQRAPEDAF